MGVSESVYLCKGEPPPPLKLSTPFWEFRIAVSCNGTAKQRHCLSTPFWELLRCDNAEYRVYIALRVTFYSLLGVSGGFVGAIPEDVLMILIFLLPFGSFYGRH